MKTLLVLCAIAFVAPVIASPQAFNYDMGLVSVAILLLADVIGSDRFGRLEGRIVELAWCLPILVMAFNIVGAPIAPLALSTLMACLMVRLWRRAAADSPGPGAEASPMPCPTSPPRIA